MPRDDTTLNNLEADIIGAIQEAIAICDQADLERESANDTKASARSVLKAKGVNKASFDMARKIANMDPDDREQFFMSLHLCLKANDLPIPPLQMDLFDPDRNTEGEGETQTEQETEDA